MSHLSKDALDNFLAVIKAADKTFLDPDKNLDEQGWNGTNASCWAMLF